MNKLFLSLGVLTLVLCATMASADLFWGAGSPGFGSSNPNPVLFQLDTFTGTVGTSFQYSTWNYIFDATCGPNDTLYVVHNTVSDVYNFKLARVDALTGSVLSDTPVKNLTGTDYPHWNAIKYHAGKLYAVENNAWGSNYTAGQNRGYIYEVTLNAAGDPVSATRGAYVGPYPDGALAYKDGVWYASDWRKDYSSWIKTGTNVTSEVFAPLSGGPGYTNGVGLISGWDFETDGDLLAVSWMANGVDSSIDDFNIYKIDLPSGNATKLYNIKSQLPSNITWLSALSATTPVPEPVFFQMGAMLGLGGLGLLRLRRR
jgi:hypothetical protein